MSARAKVEKGLAWIQENLPGRAEAIDPDRIDMMAPALCPLGQAAGHLTRHLNGWSAITGDSALRQRRGVPDDAPRLTTAEATALGFCPPAPEAATFTAEWQRALANLHGDPR